MIHRVLTPVILQAIPAATTTADPAAVRILRGRHRRPRAVPPRAEAAVAVVGIDWRKKAC